MYNMSVSGGRRLLFDFLRARRRVVLFAALLDATAGFCLVGLSFLSAQAVAAQFGFRSPRAALLGLPRAEAAHWLLVAAAVLGIKLLLDYVRLHLRGRLADEFVHTLRERLFDQSLDAPAASAEKILARFSGDLSGARRLLERGVMQYAADLSLLTLGFGFIVWFDMRLMALIGGFILIGWLLLSRVNRRARAGEARRRDKKAGLLALVVHTLSHLPGIQALNRGARVRQTFMRKLEKIRVLDRQYRGWATASEALPAFWSQALFLLVLASGGWLDTPVDVLFLAILILLSVRSALTRLLRAGLIWKKGLLTLEKIDILLRRQGETENRRVLEKKQATTLRLDGVAIRFGDKTVLEQIQVTLSPDKHVCLVLGTGGGKTALVRLLAGFIQPDQGQMLWDEEPAEHFTLHSRRRQIAFVSEAFPLTGRTLLDAVSASRQPAAMAKAEVALQHWQAVFPTLKDLNPYRKFRPGQATGISAGQEKLLQCLRALLTNKPYWVLDEPFAGLDADTARALAGMLLENSAGKGILTLTARPDLLPADWLDKNGVPAR